MEEGGFLYDSDSYSDDLPYWEKRGNKKQLIWFLEPKDDKGVAFLKIEHDNKDDEMRMWLPAFKKVRRISSKKKGDAFMGSDLSYEDLSSRNLDENDYNRLDDEIVDGKDCYVLEITPGKEANSSYSKHVSWIEKSSLMGVKEESYDKRGRLKKVKEFTFQILKDYHVIKRVFVKDVQKTHTTEVTFSDVQVDSALIKIYFKKKISSAFQEIELNEKSDLFYFSNNDIVGADQLHWFN